jgi:hypothetical protein
MAEEIINQLFEHVMSACDTLYIQRKLITQTAVCELIAKQGHWHPQYLSTVVPKYINAWRLQSLGKQQEEDQRSKIIAELRVMLDKMGRTDV